MKSTWTEKHRPIGLSDVVGQRHVIETLQVIIKSNDLLPHLLFPGPPGVGKTTVAKALAHDLDTRFFELNASDDRGINVIRERVKELAKSKNLFGKRNIVFLDEADGLTPDAQSSLRRIMEETADNCMFILCCNYDNKIIDAISSRCLTLRFFLLSPAEVNEYLGRITKIEGLSIPTETTEHIAKISDGNLRNATNYLFLAKHNPSALKESNPPYQAFKPIYEDIRNGANPTTTANKVKKLLWKGYSGQDFLRAMIECVRDDNKLDKKMALSLSTVIGKYYVASAGNIDQYGLVDLSIIALSSVE